MSGLRLHELTAGYRTGRRVTPVLGGLTAGAARGELTVLLGPNGAGKSTLLRTAAGLQPPLAGTVTLDGADLPRMSATYRARRLAVVLTDRIDAGLLSARELVEFGRHPHTGSGGTLRRGDHAAVDAAIVAVGAGHLAGRRVAELSDGERQRVLTARALAQQPSALLLDEPGAFLDATSRVELLGLLRRLAREQNLCVLVSTHDLELALRLADHVWLVDRDRRLRAGTPEQLVAEGMVAAVFDTPELTFDPHSGGFILTGPTTGTAHVHGPAQHVPLLTRALSRQGWTVVADEPADIAVTATETGFLARADGRSIRLPGWAELAGWARDQHDRRPPQGWALRRATPAQLADCLRAAASIGAYFAVESGWVDADPADWWPLAQLYRDGDEALAELVETVRRRLGTDEPRVAVSVLQLGLAARLASPLLAGLARGIVLDLDPADVAVQSRFGEAPGLRCGRPGGWAGTDGQSGPEQADLLAARLVDAHLAPMVAALRRISPVAPRLLWGNAASALAGALRMLETHLGATAARRVRTVVEQLLDRPPLAGAGTLAGPGASPAFRRRSCCLYYRTAAGGHCADCALRPEARHPEARHPEAPRPSRVTEPRP
ncbi:ATP-binding cassette domain-containing protein [Pseudonocardia hispaniensis]|uniref:ATP-binding cassette domain-containing protein n=1 Tax=Pseudonocardia hispaniensis TaxID=904933 RepID=A0ABW1IXW1_9PSEU